MFSFSRHISSTEDDPELLPLWILLNLLLDKEPELLVELKHKLSSRSNAIVFEILFIFLAIVIETFLHGCIALGTVVSPRSLVVHLCSWSNTVQAQKEKFLGLDDVNNIADVVENAQPYFLHLLRHNHRFENNRLVLNKSTVYLRAFVYDSIHVEIQVINVWQRPLLSLLKDKRVTFGDPRKEFRYSHSTKIIMDLKITHALNKESILIILKYKCNNKIQFNKF